MYGMIHQAITGSVHEKHLYPVSLKIYKRGE